VAIRVAQDDTATEAVPSRNPAVLIDLDHFKGAPRSKLAEIVKLAFDMLVGGGDTNVNGSFQLGSPKKTVFCPLDILWGSPLKMSMDIVSLGQNTI
jgi:hypothetical protein